MGRAGLAALVGLWVAAPAFAATPPTGFWYTPDHHGVVQIRPCQTGAEALCGVIVGVTAKPGEVPKDVTGVPQCHLTLLDRLVPRDDGRWHGTVRNPEDGRVYNAEVWVGADGAMRLRGFIGIELFGSTQVWDAFAGKVGADCRFSAAG